MSKPDTQTENSVAKAVNIMIEQAVSAGASDIHIEPRGDHIAIRYRIDGLLRQTNKLPKKLLPKLVSQIKSLANLNAFEHKTPQSGQFKLSINGQTYGLSVAILPIIDGEKVVLGVLNESPTAASLDQLGFWGMALKDLSRAIVQPHGLVLVTGPAGSGKATTLFSILSSLNRPGLNISTIEDPVKYRLSGANQVQLNPAAGLTFVSGIKAALDQDSNIIMVGRINDYETADLACQAALSGHLVFATLHTSDAASGLGRLVQMGVEPFLVASTVRVVVAQRLVRRLCVSCRVSYRPSAAGLKRLDKVFNLKSHGGFKKLTQNEQMALGDGLGVGPSTADLSSTGSTIKRLFKASQDGCVSCDHSGYTGRLGIYEIINGDSDIQKLIVTKRSSADIAEAANNSGRLSLPLDGLIKSLRGLTTPQEVLRVLA